MSAVICRWCHGEPTDEGAATRLCPEHQSIIAAREVRLQSLHYRVLELLASPPGRLRRFDFILDYLYGDDPSGGPDTGRRGLQVTICRLRHRLAESGTSWRIESVWGVGIRLSA